MKVESAKNILKIIVISVYALMTILFVPSPQADTMSSPHKSKNIDNIVHIVFTDVLDIDQALENWNFSGFDDAIDVIDIYNHLHLGQKSKLNKSIYYTTKSVDKCIGEISKYYESYTPDLSTPPPKA